jgi:hypothetical protein
MISGGPEWLIRTAIMSCGRADVCGGTICGDTICGGEACGMGRLSIRPAVAVGTGTSRWIGADFAVGGESAVSPTNS